MIAKKLWAEFRKPSERNPIPHHRGATAIWNAALGAQPGLVLADYGGFPAALTVPLIVFVYFWKDIIGLRPLGSTKNIIEDAFFIGAGAVAAYHDVLVGLIAINIGALAVMSLQTKVNENDGL